MDIHCGGSASILSRHLLLALGLTALLLGLLGMHTLGIDHVAPTHHAAAPHAHAGGSVGSDGQPWCAEDCGLGAAMAGMCVMALAGGSVLVHLAARAFHPVPGLGLSAPPTHWTPHRRMMPPPSLTQLSISRT